MSINQLSEIPRRGRSVLVLTGDAKGLSVFPFQRLCSSYVISYVHSLPLLAQFFRNVERRAIVLYCISISVVLIRILFVCAVVGLLLNG